MSGSRTPAGIRARRRTAPSDAGGAPDARSGGTLRELTRRRLALLVLVVLTTAALFEAFQGVHADARPLRTADAPGVLAVDTAMDALRQARQDVKAAQANAREEAGSTAGQGAGSTAFHTRISVANQSLARAAAADVTGGQGRLSIQTVTGLVATYSGWIEDAQALPPGSLLQEAYISYADSILGEDDGTDVPDEATILGRLRDLQAAQQERVRRHSDFGPLLWAGWSLAVLLALATLVLLGEAARFSSRRFRRRWNVPLLAARLLLAGGLATLVAFTVLTHAALHDAQQVLAPSLRDDAIAATGAQVTRRLAGTGFRAAAADWIAAGGLVLAALVLLALQPRISEYRVRVTAWRPPRPRTLGAVAISLALLATVGVVAVRATGWKGSVTLLANWTGTQEQQFKDKIIDDFQKRYRIRVDYEGSSAESAVLAAEVESGTPPDVAVLPDPGELAGYAANGRLTPLDGIVRAADFAATWVPEVGGHAYWVPIKTDLKSMVWYPTARQDGITAAAAQPASWCLGLADGATSGWPGSDWIEDILLQRSGEDVYERWATGGLPWTDPRVRDAWTTWHSLVRVTGRAATRNALITPFGQAAKGVADTPPTCELEHQASFARGDEGWNTTPASFVHSARLIPHPRGGPRRWEVSGDLAAVLHDTPASHQLITYLASDRAQRAWASTQSGFSVRRSVLAGTPSDPLAARITEDLRDPAAVHCYDASDAMPATERDAFALAVLRYLADPTDATLDAQLAALQHIRAQEGPTGLAGVCTTG
ncbi:ABC transporter substrate-binding protein [Streptomyces sp. NPDC020983]|uniref:ABC transporter substrate-binding protein n=1 Tax=Streptomyces sp. NPDC020983 TaxID=3365106 RepID=UPI00378ED988